MTPSDPQETTAAGRSAGASCSPPVPPPGWAPWPRPVARSASPSTSTVARSARVAPGRLRPRRRRARDLPHDGEPVVRPLLRHLPGRAGIRRPPRPTTSGPFSQPWQPPGAASANGRLLPFHLDTVHTDIADCTFDLTHAWGPQHQCRNGGKMDAFVRVHTSAANEGPTQGVLTMGYYTREDLPYYYTLADAYTICDGYHCSVMGPTHPNRLMQMSGTIDPAGKAGGPVIITNGSPDALFSVHWDDHARGPRGRRHQLEVLRPEPAPSTPSTPCRRSASPPTASFPTSRSTRTRSSSIHQQGLPPDLPRRLRRRRGLRAAAPGELDVHPGGLRRAPSGPAIPGRVVHRPGACGRWSPIPRSGRRPCSSTCTTRTTGSSTTSPHRSPLRAPTSEFLTHVAAAAGRQWLRWTHRARLPGSADGHLAVQPGRSHRQPDLRPHLAASLRRGALRGEGPQPLVVASGHGRRPHRHAALRRRRRCPPRATAHDGTTRATWPPRGVRRATCSRLPSTSRPTPCPRCSRCRPRSRLG